MHCKKSSSFIFSILLALVFQGFFLNPAFGDGDGPAPADAKPAPEKVAPKKALTRIALPPRAASSDQPRQLVGEPVLSSADIPIFLFDYNSAHPNLGAAITRQIVVVMEAFGTDAATFLVAAYIKHGLTTERFRALAGSPDVEYEGHQNWSKAVNFLNDWFRKADWSMQIQLKVNDEKPDPFALGAGRGWYNTLFAGRFVVGPVVQLITGQRTAAPLLGTTIFQMALEGMFAIPALDRKFFSPFFNRLGFAGLSAFNSAYGLAIYGCIQGLCKLSGIPPEALNQPDFSTALIRSVVLGVFFTAAYGKFQQDQQVLKETGRATEIARYTRVSSFGLLANGFRLAAFYIPLKLLEFKVLGTNLEFGISEAALGAMGLAVTLPNWVKTRFGPVARAAIVRDGITPSTPGVRAFCLRALDRVANWREFRRPAPVATL